MNFTITKFYKKLKASVSKIVRPWLKKSFHHEIWKTSYDRLILISHTIFLSRQPNVVKEELAVLSACEGIL